MGYKLINFLAMFLMAISVSLTSTETLVAEDFIHQTVKQLEKSISDQIDGATPLKIRCLNPGFVPFQNAPYSTHSTPNVVDSDLQITRDFSRKPTGKAADKPFGQTL